MVEKKLTEAIKWKYGTWYYSLTLPVSFLFGMSEMLGWAVLLNLYALVITFLLET